MSFNQSEHIGRPAPGVKKWKQPPGTRLYRYTINQKHNVNLLRQDQFGVSGDQLIRVKTSPAAGVFTSENCIIISKSIIARLASTGWSSTPANHRVRAWNRVLAGFNEASIQVDDSVIESPDCDNPNIASAVIGKKIFTYDEGYGFGPQFQVQATELDSPTVSTLCTREYKGRYDILVPTDGISSVPGATGYNGTLTLINET